MERTAVTRRLQSPPCPPDEWWFPGCRLLFARTSPNPRIALTIQLFLHRLKMLLHSAPAEKNPALNLLKFPPPIHNRKKLYWESLRCSVRIFLLHTVRPDCFLFPARKEYGSDPLSETQAFGFQSANKFHLPLSYPSQNTYCKSYRRRRGSRLQMSYNT